MGSRRSKKAVADVQRDPSDWAVAPATNFGPASFRRVRVAEMTRIWAMSRVAPKLEAIVAGEAVLAAQHESAVKVVDRPAP